MGPVDAFGVFTGGIGLFQFAMDLLPKEQPPDGAIVSIKIGDPGDLGPNEDTNGQVANIYSWNQANKYQGKTSGSYIGKGGSEEFTIDAKVPGSQSGYIGVSADADAVCIAWITVTQRDGTADTAGRWIGDIGKECGRRWHFNHEVAGVRDGVDHTPMCTWLDADHTGDVEDAALKFDVMAYGSGTKQTFEEGKMCDYTTYGPDNGPISAAPGKRSLKPRSKKIEDVLVVSSITTQSAEELCNSETSWGWDFIGPDGKYCDMDTHTLHALCSYEQVTGCINLDEQNGAKRLTRRTLAKRSDGFVTATDTTAKEYKHIAHW